MAEDLSKYAEDTFDEGFEVPPSSWIKFGKIGDVVKGTLVGVTVQDNRKKPGEKQKVYEIEVESGFYHHLTKEGNTITVSDEPTVLKSGDIVKVGGKKMIDNAMRRAEIGQKVIFRYTADFAMPSGDTAKTVVVKIGGMDPNWSAKPTDGEIPFNA